MKNLTKEMLETPRTPKQLHSWVSDTIERIGSTSEGKSAIRLKKGFAKELIEELFPLGLFAIKHFGPNSEVTITPVIGSQNYDAIVHGDEENITHVEVTQAHEGENDHLRMLELDQKGGVSATGPVTKKGTKKKGFSISVDSTARYSPGIKDEEFERIRQATIRKSGKPYPSKTALVVIFSEHLLMNKTEDMAELNKLIVDELLPQLQNFKLVAFVGCVEGEYLEYKL